MNGGRTLVLLRHGRTAWNATGRFQGQADPPLDVVGRRQAFLAAMALVPMQPVGVVTSDLRRARQTAEAVGAVCAAPVRSEPALREVALGGWEGLDDPTAACLFPAEHAAWRRGEDVRRGGGETRAEAGARAAAAVVAAAGACPPGRAIVVVSHGLALQEALGVLGQCRSQPPHLDNGRWVTLVLPPVPGPSRWAACTLRP